MKRKQKRLIALGALILALAVVGGVTLYSLGGGDGYEACASAFKKFLFECDNYTLDVSAKLTLNGQTLTTFTQNARYSKDAASIRERSSDIGKPEPVETLTYYMDGKRYYNINDAEKTYQSYNTNYDGRVKVEDSELNRRAYDLWKLLADLLAGDAKNNVVKLGKTGENTEYQMRLSESQLPEFVKLLTSMSGLIFNEMYMIDYDRVEYEDRYATFAAWHLSKTGEALPKDFFDFIYTNDDLMNAYYALYDEMDREYEAILDAQTSPCILYVAEDGTSKPYHDYFEYVTAHDDGTWLLAPEGVSVAGLDKNMLYPASVRIKSVEANALIDAQSRPVSCDFSLTLDILDVFDARHELIVDVKLAATDYDTTIPEKFNTDEYTEKVYTAAAKETKTEAPLETKDVVFDGKVYTVSYTPDEPLPASDDGGVI